MSWIQCFSFAEQVWRLAVPQRGRTQRTECELGNGRDGKFGELRLLTVTSHEKTNVIISDLWLQVGLWKELARLAAAELMHKPEPAFKKYFYLIKKTF